VVGGGPPIWAMEGGRTQDFDFDESKLKNKIEHILIKNIKRI
jgi:hypothetical protein